MYQVFAEIKINCVLLCTARKKLLESYCSNPQLVCITFTLLCLLLAFIKWELGFRVPYTGNHSEPWEGRFHAKVMNENKRRKFHLIYMWLVMIYTLPQYLSWSKSKIYMCTFSWGILDLFYFSHSRSTKTAICFTSPWLSKSLLPHQIGRKWRQIKFLRERVHRIQDFGILIWVGHICRLVHVFLIWQDQHSCLQDKNLI